jgi:tetratricopeptide (TPR) repeat protein
MGAAYDKALFLHRQHRHALAREQLAEELTEHPNSGHAHALMACCFVAESNFRAARASAETAIEAEPMSAFAHYAMAWTLYRDSALSSSRLGDFPLRQAHPGLRRQAFLRLAETSLLESLRLSPRDPDYYGLLAFVRHDLGKHELAIDTARMGLAINPAHGESLKVIALASRAIQPITVAAKASQAALAAEPTGATQHAIHGRTLLLAGRYREAMVHLTEAMRLNPESSYVREQWLAGRRARYLPYRIHLRAGKMTRWGINFEGIIIAIAALAAIFVLPLLTAQLTQNIRSDGLRHLFVGLSFAPVWLMLMTTQCANFLVQFDTQAGELLSSKARYEANCWVCVFVSLVVLLVVTCVSSMLEVEFSATMFWISVAPVVVVFFLIHRRKSRQGN